MAGASIRDQGWQAQEHAHNAGGERFCPCSSRVSNIHWKLHMWDPGADTVSLGPVNKSTEG